ncbi:MAG: pseudouridine synthase [Mycoplasmatota bacterium]|nr:pseudouridine synthase [Mycoplasmatota bacterium]
MERLQKVIANLGYTSRRKAEELILAGKVKVNGETVKELGTKVKNSDTIQVENTILDNNKNYEYYLLNKPREVISSVKDECGRKTVVELINTSERIYPIGRLDYDTTGIILLTNDGNLASKLMHPSSNIEKKYIAKVNGLVTGYEIKKLREGVIIDGKKTHRAKVNLKSYDKKSDKSLVELIIHEGRNHQVRKMFEAINHDVLKLKREKYANLDLTGLKPGEYRKLSNKEIAILYSLVK